MVVVLSQVVGRRCCCCHAHQADAAAVRCRYLLAAANALACILCSAKEKSTLAGVWCSSCACSTTGGVCIRG